MRFLLLIEPIVVAMILPWLKESVAEEFPNWQGELYGAEARLEFLFDLQRQRDCVEAKLESLREAQKLELRRQIEM